MNIQIKNICKKYNNKTALNDITLTFEKGLIHALIGENGAGKSTLAKILSGTTQKDSGTIIIDGRECKTLTSKEARKKGILLVHQTPLLAEDLTVKENLQLLQKDFILKPLPQKLYTLMKEWGINLDMKQKVKNLGGNQRFFISLTSSLLQNPDCLILDEPGAFLTPEERTTLYINLKREAINGLNIIVITHNFTESATYADTISILKKGSLLCHFDTASEYRNSDYAVQSTFTTDNTKETAQKKELCFKAQNINAHPFDKPSIINIDLDCFYGQITAVDGLQEAAIGTLEDAITGFIPPGHITGKVSLNTLDKEITIDLSKGIFTTALLRKMKTAIVPSDRSKRGSHPLLSVEQLLSVYCPDNTYENALILIKKANVDILPRQKVSELSGGMLQRLILERELSTHPRFLILCNPMQGLDIQSQNNLTRRIVELKNTGIAILIIGMADLAPDICDRVYRIQGGIIKGGEEK